MMFDACKLQMKMKILIEQYKKEIMLKKHRRKCLMNCKLTTNGEQTFITKATT